MNDAYFSPAFCESLCLLSFPPLVWWLKKCYDIDRICCIFLLYFPTLPLKCFVTFPNNLSFRVSVGWESPTFRAPYLIPVLISLTCPNQIRVNCCHHSSPQPRPFIQLTLPVEQIDVLEAALLVAGASMTMAAGHLMPGVIVMMTDGMESAGMVVSCWSRNDFF